MHRDIEKEKPVTMAMATKRMVKQVDGWMIPNDKRCREQKPKTKESVHQCPN